jgi:hypothetical protein
MKAPQKGLNWLDRVRDLEDPARGFFGIGIGAGGGVFHAAALSSLSAPRATILVASSGNGRCSALASSHGARIQTSRSSSVSRMTGMAFGWIGSTIAFGDVALVRPPSLSRA